MYAYINLFKGEVWWEPMGTNEKVWVGSEVPKKYSPYD